MRLASADQIRRIDQAAISRFGVPGVALMESAGQQVAEALLRRWPQRARAGVLVVCGRGNNGGDGFVVARHLAARGVPVEALLTGSLSDLSGDAAIMASSWTRAGRKVERASPAAIAGSRQEVVVDALLGTGAEGAPRGEVGAAVEAIARLRERPFRPRILALDIPSGVDATTGEVEGVAVQADLTVTLGLAKPGLLSHPGARLTGKVVVAPLGWPAEALAAQPAEGETIEGGQALSWLPPLDVEAHKGSRGRLLVLAGRDDRAGAAALAAYAAFRAGCGLVTVATTALAGTQVVGAIPEVMREELPSAGGEVAPEGRERLLSLAQAADAVVVGPGLGTGSGPRVLVESLLLSEGAPAVVDADALTLLASLSPSPHRPRVLTPHPGEMGRLLGWQSGQVQARRIRAVREAAERFSSVVVLKGARSLVARPASAGAPALAINESGNPGLAVAGAGDVLSGICGALLARGLAPFEASRLAVWAHGEAADRLAAEGRAPGFLARDVADGIPGVLGCAP